MQSIKLSNILLRLAPIPSQRHWIFAPWLLM